MNIRTKFSADFLLSTFGGSSNAGSSPYVTVIYRFNLGGTKLMGCELKSWTTIHRTKEGTGTTND